MLSRHLLATSIIFALTACGGGGDSAETPAAPATPVQNAPPATPPTTSLTDAIIVTGPQQVNLQQGVGLAAELTTGEVLQSSRWVQESGPTVNFLATNSQTIGFDALATGDYQFRFEARRANGETAEKTVEFSVGAEVAPVTVRLDHTVTERGKVSLRVDSNTGAQISAITWQQTGGPTLPTSELTPQGQLLFFDAPSVNTDTLLTFSAQVTLSDGTQASDEAMVLVKNASQNEDGFFTSNEFYISTDMHPFNAASPFAAALQDCVYNNQITDPCSLNRLPLLGQETVSPSVEDVMDRVLVSHDWMGERFEQYLRTSVVSDDMLSLLRGVTAVVISYDVRPSFYWSVTGAIYLDANNFWVTPQERDTLNDVPDFRSDFGNDLNFIMPWRYVKDGQNYLNRAAYPTSARLSKAFVDMEADISWLMYHELAHANDFFPPSAWGRINRNLSPWEYSRNNDADSTAFNSIHPLGSVEMNGLAEVSFRGQTANATQRAYGPSDVTGFFRPDDAPTYYSYFTEREDYATLFERFMMLYRLEAPADVGILETRCPFRVDWGQRGRVNLARLQPRVAYAVSRILPDLDVSAIQQQLPAPTLLDAGVPWAENRLDRGPVVCNSFTGSGNANRPEQQRPHWRPAFGS